MNKCLNNSISPDDDRDPKSIGGKFRKDYENGLREMSVIIEPLSLNKIRIPVLFFENPHDPKLNCFELDFKEIIKLIEGTE